MRCCTWACPATDGICAVQADIFSFGCLMYELLTGAITSQVVVGPTGNVRAAEVYAAQASDVAVSQDSLPLLNANIMSTPFVCWYALGMHAASLEVTGGDRRSDVAENRPPRDLTGQAFRGRFKLKHT